MSRAERARKLCERLAADVAKIAPAGIGSWAPAWDIVGDADAEFIVHLTAWEAAPSEPGRERVRVAYEAVLDRWREATRQFHSVQRSAL